MYVFNRICLRTSLLLAMLLLPLSSQATPDPGVHVYDRLIGVSDQVYIVRRQISLFPPTYYASGARTEFLALSVWDSRVISRCTALIYNSIDETTNGDFIAEHRTDPSCTGDGLIAEYKALPVSGHPATLPPLVIKSSAGGIRLGLKAETGVTTFKRLADDQYITSRFLRAFSGLEKGDRMIGLYDLSDEAAALPVQSAEQLAAGFAVENAILQGNRAWYFLRISIGSSENAEGASVSQLIPVSGKTVFRTLGLN